MVLIRNFNLLIFRKSYLMRCFSNYINEERRVRVRFAPSPTGFLHLGGLRTALYNYLFAKSRNGTFVLRIEDTDQSRLVPGAIEKLENDLNWAGITPDESPSVGGSYGPYIQSHRLSLYREKVDVLLEQGSAYRCFCSDRRLDLLRREALRARQVPKYDNRCRHLTAEEVKERVSREQEHCVKFKLAAEAPELDDLVYGRTFTSSTHQEGDPVIIKSDGFPTYHLANVVDDHAMDITHVLRGVEWQISTQKHLQLYKAFSWSPPRYAHLPLIMNADGTKLSKRQGDVRVEHYRETGIFPLALVNYVTNAGGGFTRQADQLQSYKLQELTEQFDLSLVNNNSCRLNPDRLDQLNSLELRRHLDDDALTRTLVARVKQLVTDKFGDRSESLDLDDQHVRSVLMWSTDRIHRLDDLVDKELAFLWVVPDVNQRSQLGTAVLSDLRRNLIDSTDPGFHADGVKLLLKELSVTHGVPFGEMMRDLRMCLSGLKEGPGVAEMMCILGRAVTVTRLEQAMQRH